MVARISRFFRRNGHDHDGHVRDEQSSAFIDNELDEKERNRVIKHLERCGLCLAFINTLRATVGLLSSTETPEPPPTLKDRIRSSLPRAEDEKKG